MKRLPMRKIRDVLQLSAEGSSSRQIATTALPEPPVKSHPERSISLTDRVAEP